MSVNVNTSTNTITVQQDGTRVIQVNTPGPQGSVGPVATGGVEKYIPVWSSANDLSTSSIYISSSTVIINGTASIHGADAEAFLVNQISPTSFNLINGHSNVNRYSQIEIQNFNDGTEASADMVCTNDAGDEEQGFIDMGINSTNYTNVGEVGGANDAYLYSTGNDLYIGNASQGHEVIIFNGGPDAVNQARIFVHDQGTIGINTDQYNFSNPPSLQIDAPNSETTNIIFAEGRSDNFIQIALVNTNGGGNASTDIAAYNDIDPTGQTDGFIDMGITSTGYNDPTNFPGWTPNTSYVYTTAPKMLVGTTNETGSIDFFLGGINPQTNRKLRLSYDGNHEITGSLSISGSSFNWNSNQVLTTPSTTTGTVVSFTTNQVYNEWDVPGTGNITDDLTGAKTGIVQKIYHNNSVAPSVPAGWVVVSNGVYVPNTLNIIYAEWVKGTRVEYWITQ